MREHYARGGVPACIERLPGRNDRAIYTKAHALGLRKPNYVKDFSYHRHETSEQIDNIIRRAYLDPSRGFTKRLAKTLARPDWWVTMRAGRLGLASPRFKEPRWTEAEDEIITGNAQHNPSTIQKRLKAAGFARTATAIQVRLKRTGQATGRNADLDHYTAHQLAGLLGHDAKTITRWIVNGQLKSRRRGTERVAAQGGDEYWIHRKDVRTFIRDNAAALDIRKVEKFWFIELLTNVG